MKTSIQQYYKFGGASTQREPILISAKLEGGCKWQPKDEESITTIEAEGIIKESKAKV